MSGLSTNPVDIYVEVPAKANNGVLQCRYWHNPAVAWITTGVTTSTTPTTINAKSYMKCTSTHLSQFGVFETCPAGYTGISCSGVCDTDQGFYGLGCASVNLCSSHGFPNHITGGFGHFTLMCLPCYYSFAHLSGHCLPYRCL